MEGYGVFKYANGNVAVRSNYNVIDKPQAVLYSNANQAHRFNMIGNGSQTTSQPLVIGNSQQNLPQNSVASVHPPMVMRPKPLPLPLSVLQQPMRQQNLPTMEVPLL